MVMTDDLFVCVNDVYGIELNQTKKTKTLNKTNKQRKKPRY